MVFPPLPRTSLQLILMVVLGLVLGGSAISFQKFMVIASSSFLGAAALITGLTGSIGMITSITDSGRAALLLIGWLLVAMVAMIVQYRMMDET
jgi:hypothetical protein